MKYFTIYNKFEQDAINTCNSQFFGAKLFDELKRQCEIIFYIVSIGFEHEYNYSNYNITLNIKAYNNFFDLGLSKVLKLTKDIFGKKLTKAIVDYNYNGISLEISLKLNNGSNNVGDDLNFLCSQMIEREGYKLIDSGLLAYQ